MTADVRKPQVVRWYRCPLDVQELKRLHERSDLRGFLQTIPFLAVLTLTGCAAYFSFGRLPWPAVVGLVFLHGTVCAFMPNGIHELGHGTVFRTRWLNGFFNRVFSFFSWINFDIFKASHARHHRYTLHTPDDGEVVLPLHVMVRDFFLKGFIDPVTMVKTIWSTIRVAGGYLQTSMGGTYFSHEWIETAYSDATPEERRRPIRWARFLLLGHGTIVAVSIYFHLWMLPVVTTLVPFYGNWLFFLCNSTQHIGLQDNVPDFRLCCRTFMLNPVVGYFYWHMNYHAEHHMYAAVPCYKLAKLRSLIEWDMPPAPRGILATWLQIAEIQRRQKTDPSYQYAAPLPQPAMNAKASAGD
jgi:fatty acid desaturase